MRGEASHSGQRVSVGLSVLACVAHPDRIHFTESLRAPHVITFIDSFRDLLTTLAAASDAPRVVVLGDRDAQGQSSVECAGTIAKRHLEVTIVAYCTAGVEHSPAIRSLAAAGVHEFLFRGVDDEGVALRAVLESAAQACHADAVAAALLPHVPPELHRFILTCLTRPADAQSVSGVARLLGVHRKTLVNYCSRSGLPTPVELLGWCRVLLAAHVIHRSGATIEAVALNLEWSTATSLRNMIKRYTQMSGSEVRKRGGLPCVHAKFVSRLAEVRRRGRRRPAELAQGQTS